MRSSAGSSPGTTGPRQPYDVQLPEGFSWLKCPTRDPEMLHALNRHRFWAELAMAYRFTGEASTSRDSNGRS